MCCKYVFHRQGFINLKCVFSLTAQCQYDIREVSFIMGGVGAGWGSLFVWSTIFWGTLRGRAKIFLGCKSVCGTVHRCAKGGPKFFLGVRGQGFFMSPEGRQKLFVSAKGGRKKAPLPAKSNTSLRLKLATVIHKEALQERMKMEKTKKNRFSFNSAEWSVSICQKTERYWFRPHTRVRRPKWP